MVNNKQVGIWLRVSTDDQVVSDSLDIHEHRARLYAESRGWEVAEVYRLEAVSGKRVIDHPEAKNFVAQWAFKPQSGLTIAPISDKRIEVVREMDEYHNLMDAQDDPDF